MIYYYILVLNLLIFTLSGVAGFLLGRLWGTGKDVIPQDKLKSLKRKPRGAVFKPKSAEELRKEQSKEFYEKL